MSTTPPEPPSHAQAPGTRPLLRPEEVPFRSRPGVLDALGRTLVVAPHPDDESLGCGGLLALLARRGGDAEVLFVTDGTGSHPHSRAFPPRRLRAVREREARRALCRLGLPPGRASFLRLPDSRLPELSAAAFGEARAHAERFLRRCAPQTLVLPWRRDPHGDHRATWRLLCAAATRALPAAPGPRLLEYPLWAWVWPEPGDHPRPGEARPWRLDIRDALPAKRHAIAAHRSQTTALIHDDPEGFRLTRSQRARFERPWELFLESALVDMPLAEEGPLSTTAQVNGAPPEDALPARQPPETPFSENGNRPPSP